MKGRAELLATTCELFNLNCRPEGPLAGAGPTTAFEPKADGWMAPAPGV